MKMSRKRKILLFKSCLLVTYQPFVFYTYIFLIHRSITKLVQQETWTNINQWCGEQDDFVTEAFHARVPLTARSEPGSAGKAHVAGRCCVSAPAPLRRAAGCMCRAAARPSHLLAPTCPTWPLPAAQLR